MQNTNQEYVIETSWEDFFLESWLEYSKIGFEPELTKLDDPEFDLGGPLTEGPQPEDSWLKLDGPEFELDGPEDSWFKLDGPELELDGPEDSWLKLDGPEFELDADEYVFWNFLCKCHENFDDEYTSKFNLVLNLNFS